MALRQNLPNASSSQSLDLEGIVSQAQADNIFDTSITFLSLTDSTRSLQSIPSFPSISSRRVFITLSSGNTLSDRPAHPTPNLTIPTIPRLKRVIKEPITVSHWAEGVTRSTLADHHPWADTVEEVDTPTAQWIPSGSLFTPEALRAILRKCRMTRSESWTLLVQTAMQDESSSFDRSAGDTVPSCGDISEKDELVPTIMLSNSTAAMPLPLESNLSVSRLASAPLALAARRGRVGPPALPLPTLPIPEADLYPGVPTPFRGSPGAYTPTFEFADSGGDFSMDLEAMCQDLRSRCPPLAPPSPIIAVRVDPLLEVSPGFASSNFLDSDEWDFARELLEEHIERPHLSSAGHTPMRPTSLRLMESPVVGTGTPNTSSDMSWATEPTLTNSPPSASAASQQIESILEEDEEEETECAKSVQVSDLPKQQRRRTVIIETPRNSVVGAARPVRMTVDLSHLADEKETTSAPEPVTTEIPFERQSQALVSTRSSMVPGDAAGHIRPISSASMGRPVRSILKTREKKSVRFSELPSTHEYTLEERQLGSVFESDELDHDTAENTKCNTGRRKRAETTPSYNPRQPSSISNGGPGDDKVRRASFPKHPVVRSLARSSTPVHSVSSTVASKGSKSGHQSMLVDRPAPKIDIGRPKRLTGAPSARSSLPTNKQDSTNKGFRKKQSKDENSWRKSSVSPPSSEKGQSGSPTSAQKSRMPFKSILTKFRS